MSAFTDTELGYLRGERRLARLATVGRDGMPHITPVGWSYNDQVGTGRSAQLADPASTPSPATWPTWRPSAGASAPTAWSCSATPGVARSRPATWPPTPPRGPGHVPLPRRPGPGPGRRQRRRRAHPAHHPPAARPVPAGGPTPGAARLDTAPGQPRAAHAFAGNAEIDARIDRVYNAGRAGAHCRDAGPGPALHGLGVYAFQFPQSATARPLTDPRPQLAHLTTPALVIKGSCDHLSWATGVDYRHALPNAQLVYLRRAGHNAYQDQPATYLAVTRAYLTGRPLPIAPWRGVSVPADYEGPAGHLVACADGCPTGW